MSPRRLLAMLGLLILPVLLPAPLAATAPGPTPRFSAASLDRPDAPNQGNDPYRAFFPIAEKRWTIDTSSLDDPYAPGTGNPGYDVLAYDLRFAFTLDTANPERPRAAYAATALIDAVSSTDGIDHVVLDFVLPAAGMSSKVYLDDAPATWFAGPGNRMWIEIPAPLARGGAFRIKIDYEGTASINATGFSIRRVGQTSDAQVWTTGGASAWFPVNNHPRDRARFRFTVTTPKGYVAVANGRRLSATDQADTTTAVFDTGVAIAPGEAAVNIAKYTVVERTSRSGVPLRHYLLRSPEQARAALRILERQLDYFAEHIAPYPYETFGVVESGANNSSSVASLFLLGRSQAGARPVYFDRNTGGLVAGQWLFSAIGLYSPGDAWLTNGLDAYLGYLYLARDQGPEIVNARLAALEWSYAFNVATDRALVELPTDGSAAAVATNKAPWAVHAVRREIGSGAFWQAVGEYFEARKGEYASLDAFQRSAEAAAGRPLGAVFDPAFRRAATPRLNLAWAQAGSTVHVRVCQLTPNALAFKLPLALRDVSRDESGGVSWRELEINQREQAVDLISDDLLTDITPDPGQALLADVMVHWLGRSPLPECAALPQPALARAEGVGGAAVDVVDPVDDVDDGGTGSGGNQGDRGSPVPDAAAGLDPAVPGAIGEDGAALEAFKAERARHLAAHLPPHLRPGGRGTERGAAEAPDESGTPSMGDPLLPYLGNTGYDVGKYTVKIRIDPESAKVQADTTIEAASTMDALDRISLDFMRMDGDEGLAISAIEVDGKPATYQRPADADKLWVDLPAAVAKDQAFAVRVRYAGTPVPGGTDVFSGGLLPHQQQTMYAISEPDGTRNWIPANDHPRDKAYYRFEVTVPKPYVATANGMPLGVTETLTETTAIFEMRQPMASYLATVAVGRFQTASQAGPNGIGIFHYFLNDPAVAMRVAGVTPDILDVFGRLVGPYAFDSYGHYAAPGFGGGMENQSMTAIGPGAFSSNAPRGQHSLIAHEAAHQWFGDALSPNSWADIWLNEGFATYFAEIWRTFKTGPEPLGWRMEALRYAVLSGGANAPVSFPSLDDMFGTNTYEKGGWVLHMLRAEIGETAFWTGLRSYYLNHKFETVTTDDLESAMEISSGKDLGALFDQWVDRPGNPTLYAAWQQQPDGTVTVRVCQGDAQPFDLPITIAIHGEGLSKRAAARMSTAETELSASAPFAVEGVTVDPDFILLADIRVRRVAADAALPGCAELVEGG